MTQIAAAVGLAEQSTFTRACRRWWGRTPTDVRRRGAP
ncbi:helix-turn-helix domain-containing protein [Rhodococcoides corynebacterioides]|nr:helix-turn-helix domain-containing protein [Rhodococcus corynebacterioides]